MKRILVINPFGIGDVIFTMTLVEEIRKAYPEFTIGFLCNERTQALVRMNRSIDQTFVFNRDLFRRLWRRHPFLSFRKLKAFLGMLREGHFDTLIDLSLGREYSFFGMLIGIKERIGFDFKGRGIFLTRKKKIKGYSDRPVADIQLDLLELLGIPRGRSESALPLEVSEASKKEAETFLRQKGVGEHDKIIAVAPGGGRSWGKDAVFKQWDSDRFAKAVNVFLKKRPFKVLLLGDKVEKELLIATAALIDQKAIVVCGEALDKVCALLRHSELLLCNDGGLLHLANALGVRTVSVFGPVDEKVYGPYGNGAAHEVVTEPVPCRPCYRNFHFPPCPYERRCLNHLPVEKVVSALEKITYNVSV